MQVLVRFLTGIVSVRLITFFIGAEGLAMVGNLRNFKTTLQTTATLGLKDGITRYAAEHGVESEKFKKTLATSFGLSSLVSIVLTILLLGGATHVSSYLFSNENYRPVIQVIGSVLPFVAINALVIAVLTGLLQYRKVIVLRIIASVLGLGLLAIGLHLYGIMGGLIAIVITEALLLFFSLSFLRIEYRGIFSAANFDKGLLGSFSRYSIMALVTATAIPTSYILIRKLVESHISLESSGMWEASLRISGIYMIFFTSGLSLYYFPKLSAIQSEKAFFAEVKNYYKIIVPLFLFVALSIFLLKGWIIELVLGEGFLVVSDLLVWQLLADLFKLLYLAFGFQLLAKSLVFKYVFIEVSFGLTLYISGLLLIPVIGLKGAFYANVIANGLALVWMLFFFKKFWMHSEV